MSKIDYDVHWKNQFEIQIFKPCAGWSAPRPLKRSSSGSAFEAKLRVVLPYAIKLGQFKNGKLTIVIMTETDASRLENFEEIFSCPRMVDKRSVSLTLYDPNPSVRDGGTWEMDQDPYSILGKDISIYLHMNPERHTQPVTASQNLRNIWQTYNVKSYHPTSELHTIIKPGTSRKIKLKDYIFSVLGVPGRHLPSVYERSNYVLATPKKYKPSPVKFIIYTNQSATRQLVAEGARVCVRLWIRFEKESKSKVHIIHLEPSPSNADIFTGSILLPISTSFTNQVPFHWTCSYILYNTFIDEKYILHKPERYKSSIKWEIQPPDWGRAVYDACWQNNLDLLRQDLPIDINAKDFNGDYPLLFAIRARNLEAVRILVEKKADVNCHTAFGDCVIQSIAYGSISITKYLLEAKARLIPTSAGETAVMICGIQNDVETMRLLVDAKARVFDETEWGDSVLHMAAKSNSTEALRYLLNLVPQPLVESQPKEGQKTVLSTAIHHFAVDVVKYLVEEVNVDVHRQYSPDEKLIDVVRKMETEKLKAGEMLQCLKKGVEYRTARHRKLLQRDLWSRLGMIIPSILDAALPVLPSEAEEAIKMTKELPTSLRNFIGNFL
uniref:Uncharacterized protein n=1 Tax=Amorphochlora amoebiformis TaxID=1561963 RepID=A0A7S0CQ64_9EUKA